MPFIMLFAFILIANVYACDDLCQAITADSRTSHEKSGKYISIGGGAILLQEQNTSDIAYNPNAINFFTSLTPMPSILLRAGTISFFTRYVGVRGFFGIDMGFRRDNSSLTMISLGIDALAEFPISHISLGGLLGIGANGSIFKSKQSQQINRLKRSEIFLQIGLTSAIGARNRIYCIYRILPTRTLMQLTPSSVATVEYSFIF